MCKGLLKKGNNELRFCLITLFVIRPSSFFRHSSFVLRHSSLKHSLESGGTFLDVFLHPLRLCWRWECPPSRRARCRNRSFLEGGRASLGRKVGRAEETGLQRRGHRPER